MVRKLFRGIAKINRNFSSIYRKNICGMLYSGVTFGPGVFLDKNVRIRVTDGGQLNLDRNVVIDRNSTIVVKSGEVVIGADTYIGENSIIVACKKIKIGRDCLIASHVVIRDQEHAFDGSDLIRHQPVYFGEVFIGDNVWLGAKCTLIKGAAVGTGSVIGANTLVNSEIPERVVAAGVPCRVIKKRES